MVELKLLVEDYKYCSEFEKIDRDRVVLDMVKYLCTQFYKGTLNNALFVSCSFFSEMMYAECMEYLDLSGIKGLCEVQMSCDRVIRIRLNQKGAPLWSGVSTEQ